MNPLVQFWFEKTAETKLRSAKEVASSKYNFKNYPQISHDNLDRTGTSGGQVMERKHLTGDQLKASKRHVLKGKIKQGLKKGIKGSAGAAALGGLAYLGGKAMKARRAGQEAAKASKRKKMMAGGALGAAALGAGAYGASRKRDK